jgi:hypothetical protein
MSVGEWDQRQLCPDGACTGLIGDAGVCRVCGRAAPNWGDERNRGKVAESPPAEIAVEAAEPQVDAPLPTDDVDDYEWSRRTLCPDGTCTGVLGGDGRCKVCGRSSGS